MVMLTLGQASKMCGRSKPTISAAVKSGRLPGKKINGVFQIHESDLISYYPPSSHKKKLKSKHLASSIIENLELEITGLKEEIIDLKEKVRSESLRIDLHEENLRVLTEQLVKKVSGLVHKTTFSEDNYTSHTSRDEEIKKTDHKPDLWKIAKSLTDSSS